MFEEHQPACFVGVPLFFGAVVFDEELVERLQQGYEFLHAADDGACGLIQSVAAQFGEDTVERLIEEEFAEQNQHP